jgi:hypothetical protein
MNEMLHFKSKMKKPFHQKRFGGDILTVKERVETQNSKIKNQKTFRQSESLLIFDF